MVDSCFVGQCAPFRVHVCAGQGSWKQLPICCVSWQCAKSWTNFHTKKQLNWIELNYLLQDISVSSSSFLADGSYYFNFVELDAWHGNDNTRQVGCCRIKSLSILKTNHRTPTNFHLLWCLGSSTLNFVSLFSVFALLTPPILRNKKPQIPCRPKNQRQEGTTSTPAWLRTPWIRWSYYGPGAANEDVVKTGDLDDFDKKERGGNDLGCKLFEWLNFGMLFFLK